MEIPTTTRRSNRAVRALVNLVCIGVALLAIVFIAPSAFGLHRYVITGGSMSGSIELGSVVFAEVVPVGDLRVGDVITYQPPPDSGIDNLVTHRIVSIDDGTFVTKGDANAEVDPWTFRLTEPSQARVSYDIPYAGHALIVLSDRDNRMILIGIPAGIVALFSLGQLLGALRRRPEQSTPLAPVSKPRVTVGG